MSLLANGFGNFLSSALPFFQSMPAIVTPGATLIKPGGRVAAYVRSTGAQDGEDHFANSGMLVSTIQAGLDRCRANQNDIVYVLPGHTETFSSSGDIWDLVAGAQIIGVGQPGCTNNPNITLSHTGASLALDTDNVTVCGLNINTATASTTGFIVVTGDGVTLAGNFIAVTAALGANPGIAVTGAANFTMVGNHVVCDSTDPVVEITNAATTNMVICGNFIRQSQATSGGDCINVANTAGISGIISDNRMKSAVAGTPGTSIGLVIGAGASPTVFNGENYDLDDAVTAAVVSTGS